MRGRATAATVTTKPVQGVYNNVAAQVTTKCISKCRSFDSVTDRCIEHYFVRSVEIREVTQRVVLSMVKGIERTTTNL